MTPIQAKLTDPLNVDDLNELILESAAVISAEKIALETSPENALGSVQDESTLTALHEVSVKSASGEETIAERLVEAGSEEAELEQRIATVINQRTQE